MSVSRWMHFENINTTETSLVTIKRTNPKILIQKTESHNFYPLWYFSSPSSRQNRPTILHQVGVDKVGHLRFKKDCPVFDFYTKSCTNKAEMSSRPTIFNNNENQGFSSPRVDIVDKGKQRVVAAPQPFNPSDPFDFFGADIVRIIITELDATDTETLRRVSKSWKAISEFYCGRTFLRQHFPEAAASLSENEIGSVEEENLRFRRHCKCLSQ